MIRDPVVIDPPDFDAEAQWAEHKEASDHIANADGSLNEKAAWYADPGIVSCPSCREQFWNMGNRQRCTECSFEFPTNWWPMYSWGAQDGFRGRPREKRYADSPYYEYGYTHPVEKPQDVAFEMDFRVLLEDVPS